MKKRGAAQATCVVEAGVSLPKTSVSRDNRLTRMELSKNNLNTLS